MSSHSLISLASLSSPCSFFSLCFFKLGIVFSSFLIHLVSKLFSATPIPYRSLFRPLLISYRIYLLQESPILPLLLPVALFSSSSKSQISSKHVSLQYLYFVKRTNHSTECHKAWWHHKTVDCNFFQRTQFSLRIRVEGRKWH
jgi:hypothetical protein